MSKGMKFGLLWLLMVPVLSGCATRYCQRNVQVYENSVEQAALQAPDGLQVPEPDPNFEIPTATGEDVSYATAVSTTTGRAETNCLDTPPNLVVARPPPALEEDQGSDIELQSEPTSEDAGANEPAEAAPDTDPVQL